MLKNVRFIKSAFSAEGLYKSEKKHIVLVGRSNVGKSSLVNFLCGNGNMARVSKEAGKTRAVNYFEVDNKFLLVDLPGYGFSKASKGEKHAWIPLIETYLLTEPNIARIFLLLDCRHEPSIDDRVMVDFMIKANLPFNIIATKTDKLSKQQLNNSLFMLAGTVKVGRDDILPVSSLKKTGLEKLEELIAHIIQ